MARGPADKLTGSMKGLPPMSDAKTWRHAIERLVWDLTRHGEVQPRAQEAVYRELLIAYRDGRAARLSSQAMKKKFGELLDDMGIRQGRYFRELRGTEAIKGLLPPSMEDADTPEGRAIAAERSAQRAASKKRIVDPPKPWIPDRPDRDRSDPEFWDIRGGPQHHLLEESPDNVVPTDRSRSPYDNPKIGRQLERERLRGQAMDIWKRRLAELEKTGLTPKGFAGHKEIPGSRESSMFARLIRADTPEKWDALVAEVYNDEMRTRLERIRHTDPLRPGQYEASRAERLARRYALYLKDDRVTGDPEWVKNLTHKEQALRKLSEALKTEGVRGPTIAKLTGELSGTADEGLNMFLNKLTKVAKGSGRVLGKLPKL